ncbi:MAG: FAD-dependent oxidoreductase, partial [Actinomycetota bacterium]
SLWDEVGWGGYECVWDGPRLYLYAQRTEDDRIAIGGGAIRYPFASRARPSFDRPDRIFRQIRGIIARRWPAAAEAEITHMWGGALGVPRDWFPSVGLDRRSGIAWAGGYAGDGVAAANLAGRTLRDLILDRDTDLVHLPWTGHRSKSWEPEPLRWLGVAGSWGLASLADRRERRTGRAPAALDAAMDRLRR